MGVKRVRIFISSPGDVAEEREKAREVVAQLQRWYGLDRVQLEAVLWEDLPIQLTTPFQQGIEAVLSATQGLDVAVFILWSRLGSALGPSVQRPDGSEYKSGTEREFELMLAAREASGGTRPALFAYVRRDERGFHERLLGKSPEELRGLVEQLEGARHFVEERFHDAQGRNLRAYHSFDVPISFARRLKVHLRGFLDELLGGDVPVGARWAKAPYRGLEVFEVDDAPIFFGREQEVCDVTEAVRRREAAEGLPFVCVVGASGAGKSSLVRAGVAASLARENLDDVAWRHAFVLPRLTDGLVAEGVARALWEAVPELHVDGAVQRDFVEEFAARPESALRLVLKPALARAGKARVLLVVDQLEEVFISPHVTAEARARLWKALEALARSGLAWVLATLRSDFYAVAQRDEGFVRLKGADGHFDLLPPSESGLTALIAQPAALAGVRFERAGERSLEAIITAEALEQPDALPLVEYLLTELYARRTPEGVLTKAAHDELGGVAGAIGSRAAAVFQALDGATQAALGAVLRRLVVVRADGVVTSRAAPRSAFPVGSAGEALVLALTRERLLLAEGDAQSARVRVTHEALLSRWTLAAHLILADKERLVARGRVEDAQKRWVEAGRPVDLLLAEGLALAEAESLVHAWREELEPALVEYVEVSRRRATRRRRMVVTVAVGVSVVLLGLTGMSVRSSRLAQEREAESAAKTKEAAAKLADAQVAQSRYLAELASRPGQSARIAAVLLTESLPRENERPLVQDAVLAARNGAERVPMALLRHEAPIWAAEFSVDGTRVVTAAKDNTAVVWELATGRRLASFRHGDVVTSARFSPDGTRVVTASRDHTAAVWEVASGHQFPSLWHGDDVVDARFSPDGSRVVTASRDKTAVVWDFATHQRLGTFSHAHVVLSAWFSPDGNKILTASADHTAAVWDIASRRRLSSLSHGDFVLSAQFSPDGSRVVTASSDHTAAVWAVATGRRVATFEHVGGVRSAQFSPDGARVATASSDKTAVVWDVASGRRLATLNHENTVGGAQFSTDGTRVVTSSEDNTAVVWDVASGRRLASLAHEGTVNTARFSPDDLHVLTASWDMTAAVWNVPASRRLASLSSAGDVVSAEFSPDGARVLTASHDANAAEVWEVASARHLASFPHAAVIAAHFSRDGARVLTASFDDRTTTAWDVSTGHRLMSVTNVANIWDAQMSPDGTSVVTAASSGAADVWNMESSQRLASFSHQADVYGAQFSPDGTRVVTASRDKTAVLWDVASSRRVASFPHQGIVYGAHFSPDGTQVVTASSDRTAAVWAVVSGERVRTLQLDEPVRTALFSPDGARIVTASTDGSAAVWDVATTRRLASFSHGDAAPHVQFSPDATRVITASDDETAIVWDVGSGRRLASLSHGKMVWSAQFSPDGTRIVTASADKTAAVWSAPPPDAPDREFITTFRARVHALKWCLTDDERATYFLPPMPAERRAAECGE